MAEPTNVYNGPSIMIMEALMLFHDYDYLLNQFMKGCQFETISKAAGLRIETKNTINEPWAMQLKKNASKDEFKIVNASSHNGSER